MAKSTKPAKKPRVVGIWMDVDHGLKLELETYAGCQRYAREAGWRLVLDPSIKRMHQWQPGRQRYDGILARATAPVARAVLKSGVPFVNLWMGSPALDRISSVVLDNEAAGVMAAEHLLEIGLRNFGYLGSRRVKSSELQFQGFRKTVAGAGFPCAVYRYPHTLFDSSAAQWSRFESGLEQWIGTLRPPVGVFVYQDVFCRFLIDACVAKGLSVPADVAIVGASDDTILCEASAPTLTSIDFGNERRGYEAAAMLDRLMGRGKHPVTRMLVPPARLVPRQSSDVFAVQDPQVEKALRYILERSDRMVAVPDVVAAAGVSRRTLERKFRAAVGHSITEEMMRLRLNRAKRRLVEAKVQLKTVARESGFQTASHFSRVFTSVFGITPSRFRAERQLELSKKY